MGSQGSFVALNNKVSQSVPHLHVHIVPRSKKDGLRGFFWPRNPYEDEGHLAATAAAIRRELGERAGRGATASALAALALSVGGSSPAHPASFERRHLR